MKSYYFTEEHELFRESLRAFIDKEVQPNIDQWEKEGQVPREVWTKMGDMGFLGLSFPEEYGGMGLKDFRYNAILQEVMTNLGIGGPLYTLFFLNLLSLSICLALYSKSFHRRHLFDFLCSQLHV